MFWQKTDLKFKTGGLLSTGILNLSLQISDFLELFSFKVELIVSGVENGLNRSVSKMVVASILFDNN